jgi:hypothetical protein
MLGALLHSYESFIQGLLTQDELPSFENIAGKLLLDKTTRGFRSGKRENEVLNQMPRGRFNGPPQFHHPPGQPPRQDFHRPTLLNIKFDVIKHAFLANE